MIRNCRILISDKGIKKAIYIDCINEKEILEYLNLDNRHKKKFKFFVEIFFKNLRNPIYKKEDINKKCKDIYAIRFFVSQENDRIYCKEMNTKDGVRATIMGIFYANKKSTELSSKEISEIEKMANYNYEI